MNTARRMGKRTHSTILSACVLTGMACLVAAFPSNMWGPGCSKSSTAGVSIMGQMVQESAEGSLKLESAGAAVECGGTIAANASMAFSLSGHSGLYLIEAVASAGAGDWGITGGECSKQRTDDASKTYKVPENGSVTVRATWALGYGSPVKVTPDCTYAVQATSSSEQTSEAAEASNSNTGASNTSTVAATIPCQTTKVGNMIFPCQETSTCEAKSVFHVLLVLISGF